MLHLKGCTAEVGHRRFGILLIRIFELKNYTLSHKRETDRLVFVHSCFFLYQTSYKISIQSLLVLKQMECKQVVYYVMRIHKENEKTLYNCPSTYVFVRRTQYRWIVCVWQEIIQNQQKHREAKHNRYLKSQALSTLHGNKHT